ncbi:MAG TPA: EAL domain-containing protein [Methylophilaceae bacterium]
MQVYKWSDLPKLGGLAIAIVLLAKLALSFFSANGFVSIVWPPSGLTFAALLIGGKRYWPAVLAGSLIEGYMQGLAPLVFCLLAIGKTLEPVIGVWLLKSNSRFNNALIHPRDYLWLGLSAALSACISAVIGVATLLAAGILQPNVAMQNLLHWWQGDVLGILLMVPIILVCRYAPHEWIKQERKLETFVCIGLAAIIGQIIFMGWLHDSFGAIARGYWMFLFIFWAAVRFGRHPVLVVIFVTALQGLLGASKGVGLFASDAENNSLTNFWFYMLVLTVIGISLMLSIYERRLAATELRAILDNFPFMVWLKDRQGRFVAVNNAYAHACGFDSPKKLVGKTDLDVWPADLAEAYRADDMQVMSSLSNKNMEEQVEEIGQPRRWFETYKAPVINAEGELFGTTGFARDVTERKEAEQIIWQQANFDPLTELPNRRMMHDRLDLEIKKAHRSNHSVALLFIDLDHFKEVNDTMGHAIGDILLQEASRRLRSCVRETDTVARLGGDEFTIILGEVDDMKNVERISQDVLQNLAMPFKLGTEISYISASIGVTIYPDDATDAEALLKNADQAMYAAKNQGRNRYHYFTQSMQKTAQSRMRLTNDLRDALINHQFMVYYQPIVDLQSNDIFKAEALVRWQHPKRGLVGPAEFIPIAEETGLIVDIGAWVFRQAAHQVKRWRNSHHPEFQISVNKSPVQFHNQDNSHPSWVIQLGSLDLPGQAIIVEITEGLLLDTGTHVTDRLQEFRDGGIQVSLDDFGTGYSSLSYLNKFNIDFLKIDQSFVRNLAAGSSNMALCEAIIVMAHKLGMKVVAEGIESKQQRDLLTAAGCDYGQGYLFSKPVPALEFEELLKTH